MDVVGRDRADMTFSQTSPGSFFFQELKDCVDELRRESQLAPSSSMSSRVASSMASSVYSSVSTRRARILRQSSGNQLRVDSRDCEKMRAQMAHTVVL